MLSIVNIIFIFVLVWCTVLFMVLPVGIKPAQNPEPGHDPGAPENPALRKRFFATTLISLVVTTIIVLLYNSGTFYNLVDG